VLKDTTPHHIIPFDLTDAVKCTGLTNMPASVANACDEMRSILGGAGIGINDGCNGALLPDSRYPKSGKLKGTAFETKYPNPIDHGPMHTKQYYNNLFGVVYTFFLANGSKADFPELLCDKLQDVALNLLEGKFPSGTTFPHIFSY
jgi:hypothetical protein